MLTVSDFVQAFGVSNSTVRAWTRDYSDYLGEGANPQNGETRFYTSEDGRVFALVAAMRTAKHPHDKIRASLAAGERGQWPPANHADDQNTGPADENAPSRDMLVVMASEYRGQLQAVTGERDRLISERDKLEQQLADERQARLDAEIRATAAETELKVITQGKSKEEAETGEPDRPGFWARLFGRG